MVTLEVYNNITRIVNAVNEDSSMVHELSYYLSFQEQDFQFTWRYKNTPWDGRHYLLNGSWISGIFVPSVSQLYFRTGLLPRVIQFFKHKRIEYVIVDARELPKFGKKLKWEGKLRDYQIEAVDAFLGVKRGILAAATGSGKSLMITNIVSRVNLPSVILCGTIDLVKQMKSHLECEIPSETIGVVGDGECDIRKITVSTWQSAAKSIDKNEKVYFYDNKVSEKFNTAHSKSINDMLKKANFVVVDESHCARAHTIQTILRYVNAPYILGTSATPIRDEGDDLLIEAELGDIFYHVSATTLIDKGWLMKPTIEYYYMYNPPLQKVLGAKGKEFHAIYKEYIVENEKRNNVICEKARGMISEGRKVLILVDYLEAHGKLLETMLSDVCAEFLHAKVSSKKRETLIKAFRDGEIDCMIATSLADEGLDVPIISGEILAGGKRGKTKVKQRVGRALRPHGEKVDAKIVDFLDDGKFVLEHSVARIASLKTEPGFKILVHNVPASRREFLQNKIARAVERAQHEQRNRYSAEKSNR